MTSGMTSGRLWAVAATGLAATLLLVVPPGPAEAQDRFPSIRIGGGHVHIGGRHVGFTGRGRDPHATGLLIQRHLHRIGDPRAHRFGPHRPPLPHLRAPVHGRFGPHHRRHHFDNLHRHGLVHLLHALHGRAHPHPLLHHGPHVIVVFHPLGAVWLATPVFHTGTVGIGTRAGVRRVADRATDGADVGTPDSAESPARSELRRERSVLRPRLGPPPPERCADVTVHMLAGLARTVRIDLRSLGAGSVAEAERALRARAARGGLLVLRGHEGGLSIPGSMVRGLTAEACPAP